MLALCWPCVGPLVCLCAALSVSVSTGSWSLVNLDVFQCVLVCIGLVRVAYFDVLGALAADVLVPMMWVIPQGKFASGSEYVA